MDVGVVISLAVRVPLGGVITLIVAWGFYRKANSDLNEFYRKANRDLNDKVDRLEHIVTLIALYLQRDGILKDVELDENRKLKGYTQTIHAPALDLKAEIPTPTDTREAPPTEHKGAEEEQDSQ